MSKISGRPSLSIARSARFQSGNLAGEPSNFEMPLMSAVMLLEDSAIIFTPHGRGFSISKLFGQKLGFDQTLPSKLSSLECASCYSLCSQLGEAHNLLGSDVCISGSWCVLTEKSRASPVWFSLTLNSPHTKIKSE